MPKKVSASIIAVAAIAVTMWLAWSMVLQPAQVAAQSTQDPLAHITVQIRFGDDSLSWSDPDECSSEYNIYLAVHNLPPPPNSGTPQTTRTHLGTAASGSTQTTLSITSSSYDLNPPSLEVELYCGEHDSSSDQNNLIASTHLAYQYGILRLGTYSSAPLTGLTVSPGTLSPSFNRGQYTDYEVAVASDVRRITLSPTVLSGFEVIYFRNPIWGVVSGCDQRGCHYSYGDQSTTGIVLADADLVTPGFQVDLDGGENRLGLGVNLGDVEAGPGSIYTLTVTVANVPATGKPAVTGTVQVGQTLTAHTSGIADEDGLGNVDSWYQWIRVDEDSTESPIAHATRASYRLADADVGKTIRVRVDFADDAGNVESLTSSLTATVTGATALSADATLSGLTLNGVSFGTFDAASTSYTARVNNTVMETTVAPTPNHSGASYVVKIGGTEDSDGTVSLAVGGNAVTVVVTAEDGQTTKTYMVTVTRLDSASDPISSDASLSGLTLSGIDFGTFQSGTTSYSVSVSNSVAQTTVLPAINDSGASYTIKLNGVTDSDGALSLRVGNNVITVEVMAEDESTTQIYTVSVTRADPPSTDATLSSLTVNGMEVGGSNRPGSNGPEWWLGTLLSFRNNVTEVTVRNNVTEVTVAPTTNHSGASYVVKVAGIEDDDGVIPLAVGSHQVTIEVTAEDGVSTRTYNLSLIRNGLSTDTRLRRLTISGIDFGTFSPIIESYTANVANSVSQTTVTPTVFDAGASYVLKIGGVEDADGTVPLAVGSNVITVEVTAEDGNTTKTYSVSVTRAAPSSTVPGVPRSVAVERGGTGELEVSWEAPTSNGGSDITGYKVQWKEASDNWDTPEDVSEATTTETSHTIGSLSLGTEYSVRVISINSAGDGPASEEVTETADAQTSQQQAANAAALTAELRNLPTSHNGQNAFTFRILFSEDVTVGFQALKEDSFEISNGTITRARRVNGRDDLRQFTVRPSSDAAVVLELEADRLCEDDGAICTSGGKRLSNSLELTVPGPAPANSPAIGAPTISGTTRVGQSLTASTFGISDTDGLVNATFNYQWLRNDGATDTDIQGAISTTYTLGNNDEGKTVKVRVSFTDDAGNHETLISEPTGTVSATVPGAPRSVAAEPAGTGTLEVTWQEPASNGGSEVTGYKVQWKLASGSWDTPADVSEAPATGTSHTISGLQLDVEHSVRVIASNASGDSPASDEATATPVAQSSTQNAPATGVPTISGTVQVGETITADTSAIVDEDGLNNATFAYQWVTDGTGIHDATGSTYTLTGDDQGSRVQVQVRFTDDAGNSETLTSVATEGVASAPEPEPEPETQEAPGAPTGLSATLNADGSITLTWTAPAGDVDGYQILRRRPRQGETDLAVYVSDTGRTATTYTDTASSLDTRYVYRVKARNGDLISEWSNFARVDK